MLKERIALHETSPITELRGVTCHMGSHSVTRTCCARTCWFRFFVRFVHVLFFVLWLVFMSFSVYFLLVTLSLVVSSRAIDCLERLISEMIYCGTLNSTHRHSLMTSQLSSLTRHKLSFLS